MKKQISGIFLFIVLLITSCTPSPEVIATQTAGAWTPTHNATATIIPTPTLDPNADPDGDGYQTSFEEAWGTDPITSTSFEDLKELDGVISFILHAREPYNFEDMNRTAYQQVRFINEKDVLDSGYFDVGPFKTLTVEVVEFPYVADIIESYTRELKYPYEIPAGLEEFLLPTNTSNTCQEEKEMMMPIVEKSETLYDLIRNVHLWNQTNLEENLIDLKAENLREAAQITTCQMMKTGWTRHSTTRANKNVSDFREAGIPSGVAISYDPTDVNEVTQQEHLDNHKYRASHHPQTVIWTPEYGFIVHDWFAGIEGARGHSEYMGLFIPIIVPDYNEAYDELRFNSDDGTGNIPRGHPQSDWLFYIENLQAPQELMHFLQPAEW